MQPLRLMDPERHRVQSRLWIPEACHSHILNQSRITGGLNRVMQFCLQVWPHNLFMIYNIPNKFQTKIGFSDWAFAYTIWIWISYEKYFIDDEEYLLSTDDHGDGNTFSDICSKDACQAVAVTGKDRQRRALAGSDLLRAGWHAEWQTDLSDLLQV